MKNQFIFWQIKKKIIQHSLKASKRKVFVAFYRFHDYFNYRDIYFYKINILKSAIYKQFKKLSRILLEFNEFQLNEILTGRLFLDPKTEIRNNVNLKRFLFGLKL